MSARCLLALAIFCLLAVTASAQEAESWGLPGAVRVNLEAEDREAEVEVGIRYGLTVVVRFDSELAENGVETEGLEHLLEATMSRNNRVLNLMLLKDLEPGQQWRLPVRFAGEARPQGVALRVVVSSTWVPHQIEILRQARDLESYRQEAHESSTRALRCEAELAQCRADCQEPGGLIGLSINDGMDARGVSTEDVVRWSLRSKRVFDVEQVLLYQSSTRVMWDFRVKLRNPEAPPWMAGGVALVDKRGRSWPALGWWQSEPAGADFVRVLVEAEVPGPESRLPLSLRLWEDNGSRELVIGNLWLP